METEELNRHQKINFKRSSISCTVDLSYSKPNVLIQFLVHSKDKAGVETILPFNLTWADTNVLFGFVNNVLNSNPNS